MERPTKITVFKKNDGYEIICMDEMSGSSIGMDMPTNGYLTLAEHFRTGAMEISSDELSGLHKHFVNAPLLSDLEYWKIRCELMEAIEKENPCDPDITSEQIKAYNAYHKFISHYGNGR